MVECSADEMNDARHGFDLLLRTMHPTYLPTVRCSHPFYGFPRVGGSAMCCWVRVVSCERSEISSVHFGFWREGVQKSRVSNDQ